MKKEIENLINCLAERIKPHRHRWVLIDKTKIISKANQGYYYLNFKWTYFCPECGEYKIFEN